VGKELALIEMELSDETLAAPAGSEELARTFVLPRQTGEAAVPPLPPLPPPPAFAAPTAPLTQAPSAFVPPPPPPAPAVTTAATARSGSGARVWIPIAAIVGLVMALAVAWGLWTVWKRLSAPEETPQVAQTVETDPVPASAAPPSPSPVRTDEPPAAEPSRGTAIEPVTREPETRIDSKVEPQQQRDVRVQAPPVEKSPPPGREPALPPPVRERPRPEAPVPAPAPDAGKAVEEEAAAPEPEPSAATRPPDPDADQILRTGLQVAFRVVPPDAHVLVDRRVIGQAREWSGQKGARTYTFPGPGSYEVKIRKPGMKDYRIAVEAGATGGVTPVAARLQPLPAADVDTTDLETIRVRQAVAFEVRPPLALISVDDQPVGTARRYSGGLGRRGWLDLPPGRHRVSIAAPGYQRKDLLVEVTAGAEKERERIELVLSPGGNE
jgi:hypothetical protein